MVDETDKNVIIVLLNKTTSPNPGVDEFRPISLLSLISMKALEKLISKKIKLDSNKFAFGFKQSHSTNSMFFVLKKIIEHCKNH